MQYDYHSTSIITLNIFFTLQSLLDNQERKERKEEYLYSAFIQRLVSKRPDMAHTVLPANYTMPAFPSQAFTRWRLH